MKTITPFILAIFALCGLLLSASGQLSFTSGVDPSAGPNSAYPAVQYSDFSNAGGIGKFSDGNNLSGDHPQVWSQQSYNITFTYAPNYNVIDASVNGGGIGAGITVPTAPANELQVTVDNAGVGDLILNLMSINAVANGGTGYGPIAPEVVGGTENFAPNTTWSAANGASLQAYLDSPALFGSEFTLNGTITLDAPANSANYGDNLNSLVEFNLTSVPEPSTCLMFTIGFGMLALLRRKRFCS